MLKVAIVGYGYLGKAYHKVFPDAVIYDEPNKLCMSPEPLSGHQSTRDDIPLIIASSDYIWLQDARQEVNSCDITIVAVPTDLAKDGELDMSIVEDVVSWLETPTILIKSALQPGTVDRLVKETGKNIAVSVELIGEGTYYQPPHKYPDPRNPKIHQMIVVGGQEPARSIAAELLWSQMSPDIRIHLVSALEAEITKMAENTYGAMKVTWSNVLRDVCDSYGANFIKVHQAWSEDGRVDPMHTRSVSFNRGWNSKCYNKDVRAFAKVSKSKMLQGMVDDNQRHLDMNDKQDMVGKRG